MQQQTKCVLNGLYKNASVGKDAILCVLDKAQNPAFRKELCIQLQYYETQKEKIRQQLQESHLFPQEQGTLAKLCCNTGIQMRCLRGTQTSNLAKIMVEGTNMGLIQLSQLMNRHTAAPEAIQKQGNDMIRHEEHYLNRIKPYL